MVTRVVEIYGPLDGQYKVSPQDSSGVQLSSTPVPDRLKTAHGWVLDALAACLEVGADWELRGQDETHGLLRELQKAGHAFLEAVVAGDDADDIRAMLKDADIVRARTGEHHPWEFLYFGGPDEPFDINLFLGANAVVGRTVDSPSSRSKSVGGKSVLPVTVWDGQPANTRAPIGLAEDRRLGSAKAGTERRIFTQRGLQVNHLKSLSLPTGWQDLDNFVETSTLLTHFNSHAVDELKKVGGGPHTAALYVSDRFEVDLDKIIALPICEQSMVFLNCCNAISLMHGKKRSLADAFAKGRVSVVVAPTGKVADGYASRWADHFYDALVKGETVATAMLHARRTMLKEGSNPMGLLYGFLGRHDARLPLHKEAA